MWNGAAPNLNAIPATMKATPVNSIAGCATSGACTAMAARSMLPVAPYTTAMMLGGIRFAMVEAEAIRAAVKARS